MLQRISLRLPNALLSKCTAAAFVQTKCNSNIKHPVAGLEGHFIDWKLPPKDQNDFARDFSRYHLSDPSGLALLRIKIQIPPELDSKELLNLFRNSPVKLFVDFLAVDAVPGITIQRHLDLLRLLVRRDPLSSLEVTGLELPVDVAWLYRDIVRRVVYAGDHYWVGGKYEHQSIRYSQKSSPFTVARIYSKDRDIQQKGKPLPPLPGPLVGPVERGILPLTRIEVVLGERDLKSKWMFDCSGPVKLSDLPRLAFDPSLQPYHRFQLVRRRRQPPARVLANIYDTPERRSDNAAFRLWDAIRLQRLKVEDESQEEQEARRAKFSPDRWFNNDHEWSRQLDLMNLQDVRAYLKPLGALLAA